MMHKLIQNCIVIERQEVTFTFHFHLPYISHGRIVYSIFAVIDLQFIRLYGEIFTSKYDLYM